MANPVLNMVAVQMCDVLYTYIYIHTSIVMCMCVFDVMITENRQVAIVETIPMCVSCSRTVSNSIRCHVTVDCQHFTPMPASIYGVHNNIMSV